MSRPGYMQIYTGEGKGKTTAALGLVLRAWGHDQKIIVLQFMKHDATTGEAVALRRLGIENVRTGLDHWVLKDRVTDEDRAAAAAGLERARAIIMSGEYDVVVLDELWTAVWFELLPLDDVLALLRDKPAHTELVTTGHHAPAAAIDAADLVTEMQPVKHFFDAGVKARPGIEY